MNKQEFIKWISDMELNLNGASFSIDNLIYTKNNSSGITFKCEKKDETWFFLKTGPSDRTGEDSIEILTSVDESYFFNQVKEYLEDEDYVNNYYSTNR